MTDPASTELAQLQELTAAVNTLSMQLAVLADRIARSWARPAARSPVAPPAPPPPPRPRPAPWAPQKPAANKRPPRRPARLRRVAHKPIAPVLRPAPCPAGTYRLRFSAWVAAGIIPSGIAAAAVASAYVRRFGVQPRRDPSNRKARCYSLPELGQALRELGVTLELVR